MFNSNSITNKKPVKVGNKIIGFIEGDTFRKLVTGSVHMLKYPKAWSVDAGVFDNVIQPSVSNFIVEDEETELEYWCSVKEFNKLKVEFERGFGRQYFLPLTYWKINDGSSKQLSLFGGLNA